MTSDLNSTTTDYISPCKMLAPFTDRKEQEFWQIFLEHGSTFGNVNIVRLASYLYQPFVGVMMDEALFDHGWLTAYKKGGSYV